MSKTIFYMSNIKMLQIRLTSPLAKPCSSLIPPCVQSHPSTELAIIIILFYIFAELFPMSFENFSSCFVFIYLNVLLMWFHNQFLQSLTVDNEQNLECTLHWKYEASHILKINAFAHLTLDFHPCPAIYERTKLILYYPAWIPYAFLEISASFPTAHCHQNI